MNRRLPPSEEPNEFARLLASKRRRGARPLLDLTLTNPGAVGLASLDDAGVVALAEAATAPYEPDPRGLPSAREAVAQVLSEGGEPGDGGRRRSTPDPARVFLTSSTSEGYAHLFRLLCEPGDSVVVPRPSYPLLEPIARLEDVRLESYRLAYDGRWRLDVDSLEAVVGPRTRAIVVVEPNNPTGSVLTPQERAAVEDLAARRGLAIISDEVFREFPWDPARPLPTWVGRAAAPTFVLGGISKSCGLPQMKLGWIALDGPPAEVERHARGLEWILDLFLSVATPVQVALPRLLARRSGFREAALARVRANLSRWRAWPGRHAAEGVEVLEGDGGWSAIIRWSGAPAAGDAALAALERCDVALHPAHFYDWPDDRAMVASLLTPPEVLEAALGRLEAGMAEGGSG
jgi:alanine-synthesizing transaminase